MKVERMEIEVAPRQCDGCTACCEGWLSGEAYGHKFWPGRKCDFCLSRGCEIYEKRPQEPCVSYRCAWLRGDTPAWLKPSECGAILTWRTIGKHDYLDVVEAGRRLDPVILSWLLLAYANGQLKNIRWMLNGGLNFVGSLEFVELMTAK